MKVFAGDEHIITSLQRDFGIYCVNVFSLIQAARVLSLPSYCIQALIEKYCGLTVCGLPSTCDWRLVLVIQSHSIEYDLYRLFVLMIVVV